MQESNKNSFLGRLKKIEGQVRGVARMVDEDRYCIDVVTQIQAIRAALLRVEKELLKSHVSHCVEEAILGGDPKEQRKKVAELLQVLGHRST
jgi:CsoR family transcriptional regulator, copper-sensing transcriptional repressor